MRAGAARSFMLEAGVKASSRGETSTVMPRSLSSSAVSRSDSLNAAACASDDRLRVQQVEVESRDLQLAVLVAPREQLDEVLALQRLCAVREIAVRVVLGLEQLHTDLQLVCHVECGADLLDVGLAGHIEQLALDGRHLAVHHLVRHAARMRRQLDAEEACKDDEEQRHLVV